MTKLTRKSYKRKKILLGVCLFASFALISTGFAAWVISSNAQNSHQNNINVGIIKDSSVQFENVVLSADSFKFEPKQEDLTGRVRYEADSGNYECLDVTVSGTITPSTYLQRLTIRLEVTEGLNNAVTKGYIQLPECATAAKDVPLSNIEENPNAKSFSYTISFAWGAFFKNENPSIYYDTEYVESTEETPLGSAISDDVMKASLLDLRNTICEAEYTLEDQQPEAIAPKVKIVLEAYTD